MKIARFLLVTFLLLSVSVVVFAQSTSVNGDKSTQVNEVARTCTPNPCPKSAAPNFALNFKLQNPLKVNTIEDAIGLFMRTIVKIAIPFIIVFFIWSGLKFILARGDPKGIGEAKSMFFATLIGTLLILGAWTITNAIVGTINSVASSSN